MLENLFVTLLEISVTTGIIILLLKLLSSLLNKSYNAKWKYWIWLVLALRLIVPFNFSFPIAPVEVSIPNTPISMFVAPAPVQPSTNIPSTQIENGTIMPKINVSAPKAQIAKSPVTIMGVAMLIWLIGASLFLVYQVTGYFIFRKKALRWSKSSTSMRIMDMLRSVTSDMRINSEISILISENVSSPLMIGFAKPILLLPSEDYSETDLYLIFRHELTHYKRHDLWYKLFLVFVNAAHWFNPLVYLLSREASADLELSCDDEVTKGMSYSDRKVYSETILASITRQKTYRTALSTYFHGGEKTIKSRFMNILSTKRKRNGTVILLAVILTVGIAGGLVACTVAGQNQNEDDGTKSTAFIYENMGYTVQLPEEYRDKVVLLPTDELDANTIIAVYQAATLERNPEFGWGMGFLFRIVRHTPAEFESYWPYRVTPTDHFAKDSNYFYSIEWPSDVQSDPDVSVREEYNTLVNQASEILSRFITNNSLTEYDHSAVESSEYTYPGIHAVFSVTLSNDAKFDVILSKPIRQDDSGIWCVERMYDEYRNQYIAMPETDLTAMEYYAQLQADADEGHRPELLDAQNVALTYLDTVWDYARHIKDSSINYGSSLRDGSKNPSISELAFDNLDLSESAGVGMPLVYESENFIIFYGDFGLFGYDLENREITFAVDFIKTFGRKGSVQGSYGTGVEVSHDGQKIVFIDTDPDHPNDVKEAYFIDIPTLTYTRGEYRPIENTFLRENAVGYVRPGGTIKKTVYIRGEEVWNIFD